MALDASAVRVAVTGAVSVAPLGTAAPTGTASALASHVDLGYISEDGVTRTMPGSGDVERIRAWQGQAIVRTLRTASEDNPTYSFTLIETNKEAIEFALGVTVTQTVTEGSFVIDTNATREHVDLVLDIVDGEHLIRDHLPRAIVTELGDTVFSNGEAIGVEVTVEAERDNTLGYNVKEWSTGLAS